MNVVEYVDSHTGGEPTRVLLTGPDLGTGSIAERCERHAVALDRFRTAVVCEPRGSEVLVGAYLVPTTDATAGVIFFNNVGLLGMCGHGLIGVVTTLAYLGKITPGDHTFETCVGPVTATLHPDGSVSIGNVPSYRLATQVNVNVPGVGPVVGDVAYGGNWFFLTHLAEPPLHLAHVSKLTHIAREIRTAVQAAGYPQVDHVELVGPPVAADANGRNFMLCPGDAYDRSPCGTGTSAKLACLAADGKLAPGETWVQESILGTCFLGRYERAGDAIRPTITGQAYITARGQLLFDPADPFRDGISAEAGA